MDWRKIAVFENTALPNIKISLNGTGGEVWVSVNIEPEMKKYLSPNNIYKGDTYWVYGYKKQVENLTLAKVAQVYSELMPKLRIACREAKKKVLQEEIVEIGKQAKIHVYEQGTN